MATTLTPEKRIEILEILLMEYMGNEDIKLSQVRRHLGNFSAKTKIEFNHLCEVLEPIAEKMVKKIFVEGKKMSIPNASKYTATFPKSR